MREKSFKVCVVIMVIKFLEFVVKKENLFYEVGVIL